MPHYIRDNKFSREFLLPYKHNVHKIVTEIFTSQVSRSACFTNWQIFAKSNILCKTKHLQHDFFSGCKPTELLS